MVLFNGTYTHTNTHTLNTGTAGVTITAKLSGTGTDVFTWTPPAGIAITAQTPAATTVTASSTITFTAPVIPANTLLAASYSFSVFAGTGAAASDTQSALVTVSPPPDTVQLTAVTFRCDKHRLILTAQTSVTGATLTLLPYVTNNGATFNPASLATPIFTNTGK